MNTKTALLLPVIALVLSLAIFGFEAEAQMFDPDLVESAGAVDFTDPEIYGQVQELLNQFRGNVGQFVSNPNSSIAPQIEITLEPRHPEPGAPFTASINDYLSSLQGSYIMWLLDGEVISGSENKRTVSVTAGAPGETMVLEAVFLTPAGIEVVYDKEIMPSYLDIIIEPQTRVPDFYLGRALPSYNSTINATAVINGDVSEAQNLVYHWKLNHNTIGGGPIRGSNQIAFLMPMGKTARLTVEVSRPGGEVLTSKRVNLPSLSPELYFYQDDPLFGVSRIVADPDYLFVGNSITLRAEPYYLDINVYNNPDLIEWEVDNQSTPNSSADPYQITLQKNALSGSAGVSFHVRSLSQVLQGVEDRTRITF